VGGTLYGTTTYGGSGTGCDLNCGTVFSVTTTGSETVLHSFQNGPDGSYPYAGLIDVKGTLYGTTSAGSGVTAGTVFSVTTSGVETSVYNFTGTGGDGESPYAGLLNVKGELYGTTVYGGVDFGTVFSIPRPHVDTILHAFRSAPEGATPNAGVIKVGNKLYGTTTDGGIYGSGTVYLVEKAGIEIVITVYTFTGLSDGAQPYAGLIDVAGTLYGTTSKGGAFGYGTVFKITP